MTWIRVSFLTGSIHILIYTLLERGIRGLLGQCFVAVQSISHVWLFANPWTAAHQASLSITISQSLLKLIEQQFIEIGVPSNHLILPSSISSISSCLQSFPESESFLMSQFFESGGPRIGASASASVLPMNIQDWFPLGLTGLMSLLYKGLSRVFANITVQKHQFFAV